MKKRKKKGRKGRVAVASLGLFEAQGASKKPMLQSTGAMLVGTVGGAFAGAAMGKPSLYSGLATTLIGYLTKIPVVSSFGMGMVVSGGYQMASGVNGPPLSGVKERIKAFGDDFKQRLYLDKIIKPKDQLAIEGMGNVQYFRYPLEGNDLDMSALDKIQRDLEQSARQFQQGQLRGAYDNPEDRIY